MKANRDTHPESTTNTNESDTKKLTIDVFNSTLDSHLNSRVTISFNTVFKSIFWQIVDDGQKPEEIPNEGILGEFINVIYFSYNILVLIVLLNLLIATMNSTVQCLEDKRELYWKYTRTSIWIEHFDDSMELPLPYSPLHIFKALLILFKRLKKLNLAESNTDNCDLTEEQNKKRLVYVELIKDLSRRIKEAENDKKKQDKINGPSTSEESKSDLKHFEDSEEDFEI